MPAPEPLVVDGEIQPGQTFRHGGAIIFKSFVPDSVEVRAEGDITLEQGGGNDLDLKSGANIIVSKPLGNEALIKADGAIRLDKAGDRLQVKGLGTLVMGDAGQHADIAVDGGITAGNIGAQAMVMGRSLTAGALGAGGKYLIDRSVTATTIGPKTSVDCGGAIDAAYAGKDVFLRAESYITLGAADEDMTAESRRGRVRIGPAPAPPPPGQKFTP